MQTIAVTRSGSRPSTWHGASPNTEMTHIAIHEEVGGKNVEWMEQVSDEQYGH